MWGLLSPLYLANVADADRRRRREYRSPDQERRRDWPQNGNVTVSLPLWLQAIKTLGTTGAIAVFLVWVGSNELPKIARQTVINAEAIARLHDMVRQQEEHSAALLRLLQRVCANTAKTENERLKCFDR